MQALRHGMATTAVVVGVAGIVAIRALSPSVDPVPGDARSDGGLGEGGAPIGQLQVDTTPRRAGTALLVSWGEPLLASLRPAGSRTAAPTPSVAADVRAPPGRAVG